MTVHERTSTIQLGAVLAAGRIWIVSMAVLGLGAGVLLGVLWPKYYEAEAVMTVESTDLSQSLNMETEQLVASSTAVMTRAADELNTTAGDVRASVRVYIPQGTTALEFVAEREVPEDAASYANSLATAYLDHLSTTNGASHAAQVQMWQGRIATLEEELEAAPADSNRAEAIAERLTESERALLDLELGPTESDVIGSIVSPAEAPVDAATPGLSIFVSGGLVAGALLGMCCAVFLSRPKPTANSTDAEFHDIVQGSH